MVYLNEKVQQNAVEGENQRQAQVGLSNDAYLTNADSSARDGGRQLQQYGVEYDIPNHSKLSGTNNGMPVEMDITAKLRGIELGTNIPNTSVQAQGRTENMSTSIGEGASEELQVGENIY